MKKADVLIIGSGVAALQLAKRLRDDKNVIIITKSKLKNGNSNLAQGGVAAAIGKNDHPDSHFADTLEAGGFHNDRSVVLAVTREAPELIKELWEEGCRFDTDEKGGLLLGMEGAHSESRIVHGGGDATGQRIMEHLVPAASNELTVIENTFVFDLIIDSSGQCIGAKGKKADGNIESFFADHIVLATGGCGQLYSHTSNAETVTGDGIALAYKAGAEIADMEFIQFHPTLLYIDGKTHGLISEAVRGDGGRLVTESGEPIMDGIHPMGDLAPRHIVAQTIYDHLRAGTQIYLDVSTIENFSERFPTITALCEKHHVDWKHRVPVAPGSHFLMGGVKTDLIGQTSVKGLYAIGETACTGLHGANRLASNSLLEGLFMGKKLAEWINGGGNGTEERMRNAHRMASLSELREGSMRGDRRTSSLSEVREESTWDAQRTTPLTEVREERMWGDRGTSLHSEAREEHTQEDVLTSPLSEIREERTDVLTPPLNGINMRNFRLPEVKEIRKSMMDHVGIVRSEEGLVKHKHWLEQFHIEELLKGNMDHFTFDELTRAFMLISSWLITDSALKRTESRGGHFRSDFPCENNHDWMGKQIIQKRSETIEHIETAVAT